MMDARLRHPFSCLLSGPSNCGKTTFVLNAISSDVIDTRFDDIVICYTEMQPAYEQVRDKCRFIHGLIDPDELDPRISHLVILDDQLGNMKDGKIVQFFTRTCHHRNTSIFFLVQNLFDQGPGFRTCSLNSSYIVLFPSARDKRQIMTLQQQMFPTRKNFLIQAYNDACREAYSHLLLDLKADCPDHLRIRARILDPAGQTVYLPDDHQIQL